MLCVRRSVLFRSVRTYCVQPTRHTTEQTTGRQHNISRLADSTTSHRRLHAITILAAPIVISQKLFHLFSYRTLNNLTTTSLSPTEMSKRLRSAAAAAAADQAKSTPKRAKAPLTIWSPSWLDEANASALTEFILAVVQRDRTDESLQIETSLQATQLEPLLTILACGGDKHLYYHELLHIAKGQRLQDFKARDLLKGLCNLWSEPNNALVFSSTSLTATESRQSHVIQLIEPNISYGDGKRSYIVVTHERVRHGLMQLVLREADLAGRSDAAQLLEEWKMPALPRRVIDMVHHFAAFGAVRESEL